MADDDLAKAAGWTGPEAEFRRIVFAAWHEFRYPRPATDEPPGAFERAVRAALDEAAAVAPTVDRVWLAAVLRDASDSHHTASGLTWSQHMADYVLARGVVTTGQRDGGEQDG